MHRIIIAAIAVNTTPLDWRGNGVKITNAISKARGASLICLPELCISGYGCEDAFLSRNTHRKSWEMLMHIAGDVRGTAVVGLPVFFKNRVFNAGVVITNGHIQAIICKQNLASEGIHYENRWFTPWPANTVETYQAPNGEKIPIGDIVVETNGIRIGLEICQDAWVYNRSGGNLARRAVDIILNPSASHFSFNKDETRRRLVIEGSRAFRATYVYANLLGNEAGRVIYDGQTLIASNGELLNEGPRFSMKDHVITLQDVNIDLTRLAQASDPTQGIDLSQNGVIKGEAPGIPNTRTNQGPPIKRREPDTWETGKFKKEEEFTRALTLGLYDYMRKSHTKGFAVSLSGGADSAAVVTLVHLMAKRMEHELNPMEFRDACGTEDIQGATRHLLTTVYQATAYSGEVTRNAAAMLAAEIGASHHELDVEKIHQEYLTTVGNALGIKLGWGNKDHDIPLQNIQARVRAPGVWMIANLLNQLLLATSNRSEAAVGYATMDGDTCGSISPIGGIDKHFLRNWLRWMQLEGFSLAPDKVIRIHKLALINDQQPTAELRPQDRHQTDEDDLMPYDVLDALEDLAIRDKESPLDCLEILHLQFGNIDVQLLKKWVDKFFTLWSRNQWKRERYAPAFHLDDHNLDPKTACRWPILSGGFKDELNKL